LWKLRRLTSIDLVTEKALWERPCEGGREMEAKPFMNVNDLFGFAWAN
jgi:hypothetical protein